MNIENNQRKESSFSSKDTQLSTYLQQNMIGLIKLWQLLIKHKRLINVVLLIFSISGIVLALTKPVHYSFSTMIQIGTVDHADKTVLIESTETALSKITSAYIPFVLAEARGKTSSEKKHYAITASVPPKSDVLVIEARGTVNEEPEYKKLIDDVVDKLITDHSRIANLKIKHYEVSIAHSENNLAGKKDSAKLIATNIEQLNKTSELLTTQLNEKKQLLDNALKNRKNVNANNTSNAMNVLVIDSEIQRYQQMIDDLEKRVLIDLKQLRRELEKSLADNIRDQNDELNNIDQLKNMMLNISNTKAIIPVMISQEPVGLGKSAIILIAILFGLTFGIVGALLYEIFLYVTDKSTPFTGESK